MNSKNYERLDVQLNESRLGNSTPNDQEKYSIAHLNLVTAGKSSLEFNKHLTVKNAEGKLSDSTSTNLPMYMLRAIIK